MGLFDIFRRREREPGMFEPTSAEAVATPNPPVSAVPPQDDVQAESKTWSFPDGNAVSLTVTSGDATLLDATGNPELREQILAAMRAAGIDPETLGQPGNPFPGLTSVPGAGITHVPEATGNLVDDLGRLAQLRASGALTEAEFQTAKGKLLSDAGGPEPPSAA